MTGSDCGDAARSAHSLSDGRWFGGNYFADYTRHGLGDVKGSRWSLFARFPNANAHGDGGNLIRVSYARRNERAIFLPGHQIVRQEAFKSVSILVSLNFFPSIFRRFSSLLLLLKSCP